MLILLIASAILSASGRPAVAADELDAAAASLASDPVYVDPTAERALSEPVVERLRERLRGSGSAIFLAVLPGDLAPTQIRAARLPIDLAEATGLSGTYAVVVGDRFRAASTRLQNADELATSAFQARNADGTAAVLEEFIDRVKAADQGAASSTGNEGQPTPGQSEGRNPISWLLLAALAAGAVGLLAFSGRRRRVQRRAQEAELDADRQMLRAELSVVADDVIRLEPHVATHPEAAEDYAAAVGRFRAAEAALDYADEPVDLTRVARVITEARYAMSRSEAVVNGREPPPPPAELRQPGRHDEPPLDTDELGRPYYVGHGAPFYGGG